MAWSSKGLAARRGIAGRTSAGFKENSKIFLLCLSKSVGYPIPKQGMPPETINAIRQRWGQKLKRLG